MTTRRRWLALDADLFGKRFTHELYDQFGTAGVAVWVAYLCACKRSRTPGVFHCFNSADALGQLGLIGWELVDNAGDKWTLNDFWTFTGRKKQTKRIAHGREMDVVATHWGHWQNDARMEARREQMRSSRAQKRDIPNPRLGHATVTNVAPDTDTDTDTDISPLPPSATISADTTSNGRRGNGSRKPKPPDPLIERVRQCVPGTGHPAAAAVVSRLRDAGIADLVIDEAAGYAAEHGANSAHYIETVARDWMSQRDPTWRPPQ